MANMVVIAVIALAITATALANAKLLLAATEQLSTDTSRLTGAVFQSSLIGQQKRQKDEREQASPAPGMPADGKNKGGEPLHGHTLLHVLFWMAYLLIELPARRLALACRSLPASFLQSLGSSRTAAATPLPAATGLIETDAATIGRKFVRIMGGILILPLLLMSWTIQLLFYNVLDILTVLGRLTKKTFYALVTPSNANRAATDTKIVSWLIDPPSSLRPVRKFMANYETSEMPSPEADEPMAADGSDSSSPKEV